MSKNLKILIILIILSGSILAMVHLASAANLQNVGEITKDIAKKAQFIAGQGDGQPVSIEVIIRQIITVVLGVFGLIYFMYIIVGGILWLTAHGEKEKIEKAKDLIQNATLGLAILLGAYALTYFILYALLTSQVLPKG
jgi:hypothetical protein